MLKSPIGKTFWHYNLWFLRKNTPFCPKKLQKWAWYRFCYLLDRFDDKTRDNQILIFKSII